MEAERLELEVFTRRSLGEPGDCLALFDTIGAVAPDLLPRFHGTSEPVWRLWRGRVPKDWGESTFLWNARRRGADGSVFFRYAPFVAFSAVRVTVPVRAPAVAERVVLLLERLMLHLEGEYGLVHPVERDEIGPVAVPDLQRGVPDLCWCTAMGGAFREAYGGAPAAHEVRELDGGALLILLSREPGFERRSVASVFGVDAATLRSPFPEPEAPPPVALPDDLEVGEELLGPGDEVWVVRRIVGDLVDVRRVSDDAELMVGDLGGLLAAGAFRRR